MRLAAIIFDSETLSAQVIVDSLADAGVFLRYEDILARFRGKRFALFAGALLERYPVMNIAQFTHAFRLPHFAGRIASAYEVGSWKPDPGLILHAASLMATPPGKCLLVEDSHAGVEAGLATGVNVVGYRLPAEVRRA
jgi:HAD superfamily hydrolase (TIGR01509 family)